ncbi:amino acid adenylation domain-containing protein [Kitasatospora sp. NPDC127111]|uniref:non-ribosomal peptide synthetase n=1 Tax=Kitasatospora sp. NPDC127111 TaxID=3345363 RepID=UPI00363AD36B
MSPTEWLYLAAHRLGRAMVLHLVVEGEGTPDPDALRAAVAAAAESCPGSRLARRGRGWVDTGRSPRVRVAEGDDGDPGGWNAMLGEPLDLRYGPACEVLLRAGGADRPTALAFRAFHGVMDGHGAQIWMAEVFRALRGEPARPARSPLTDARLLAETGATGRRPALLLDQPSPLGASTAGQPGPDAPEAVWLRRTLPGRYASLTARLAQAVADAVPAARARVMVPVDLRRHRRGEPATGNLTLPVFLDLRPDEPWRGAHQRLLRALAERRELAGGFESALARLPLPAAAGLLRAGQSVADRRGRHLASAIVSHLGRIDPADYSGGGFTARSVHALPVHAPLVPVSCVAVELPDRTELTVGFQGGPGLALRAEELMDRLVAAVTRDAAVTSGPPAEPSGRFPEPSGPPAEPSGPFPEPSGPFPDLGTDADGPWRGKPVTTVVAALRRHAARTPDAVALDGPAGPVSYAELDRRSDAVAVELLRRGVGREDLVGLIVERSPAGVAALWGVLKAGAAYLPLDPRQPDVRIAGVLHEAGARLCLTERHLVDRLAVSAPCDLLVVQDVPDRPESAEPVPLPDPAPDQLAYVIHTSGSTGRPKGVQIEHRGLFAFARWAAGLCAVDEHTRFGFLASLGFDISCFPLFVPALYGGAAVLLPGEPTAPALRDLLTLHRTDALAVTPTHLDLMEHYGLDLSGLRSLLVGGEQFTRAAAERARRRVGPGTRIINGYGPTEATVGCLAHVLDGDESGPVIPIGRPAPGARIDLLGADGEFLAPERTGAVGEILVSGVHLSRGYLGRPDLDAAAFPVGADGVRRYRTGDLARRLPDGALEFVGRADDQVKIAGHRIEPAEVRTALEGHPAVLRAAVTVRTRPGGTAALCAYVLPTDPGAPEPGDELRAHLATLLPAHLVPASILAVDALPATASGKTDFAALPDPFPGPAPGDDASSATDDLDARVAQRWARTLGVDARVLGRDADFQQLGGDSLALLEMLSAVADELVAPAGVDAFMADLGGSLTELTLGRVSEAVRRAGPSDGRTGGPSDGPAGGPSHGPAGGPSESSGRTEETA